ncbi:DUF1553 domain-containing protein [Ulvibacterium sp.]|uniref:DUF1553 domain-containing protein n=1 Tax=Ulvibacterium sp. TaxID=2665914 RepID=UPI003CC61416
MIEYKKLILGCLAVMILSNCTRNPPDQIEMAYEELPDQIDFNYHVKPILSDKCFACHGPDMANQKAGLRLDLAENAYNALEGSGKHPVIPGKPGKSEIVRRMLSEDPVVKMPPPEFKVELSEREIATLVKWVEQGAEYKPHWSFIVPKKEELPEVSTKDWVNNEIDFFIGSRLEKEKLKPSEKATKESLIRRLNFDLIGLPPTLQQIQDFVNDTTDQAYEKVVNRLLASPAYGEHMAAVWMDVARYADSDGYLDDKHRDFSPYRDWVIKAFNENMSYEKFTTWQLAGDLIENPTQESKLATAFNRLHKKNSEAGIVFEEYRVEYVADRTLSVGKAFLGLSVECARCHDHKYDAISQKDHYELFAFFNSTNELGTAVYGPGQVPGPSLLLTNEEQEEVLHYIDTNINVTKKELVSVQKERLKEIQAKNLRNNLEDYLQKGLKKGLVAQLNFDSFIPKDKKTLLTKSGDKSGNMTVVKEPELKKGVSGKAVFFNDYTAITLPDKVGWFDQSDPFSVSVAVFPDTLYEEASIFTHCEETRLGLKGYSMHLENNHLKFIMARSWPSNAIQVKTKNPIAEKEWSHITVSYDGLAKAEGVHIYVNGKEVPLEIEINSLYKSILFRKNVHNYPFYGFTLGVRDKFKTLKDGGIDNLRIYNRELSALEVMYDIAPDSALKKVEKEVNGSFLMDFYYTTVDQKTEEKRLRLQQLRKERIQELEPIKEIMVLGDLPEPRPTYILDRGMYDAPTKEVVPDVPEAIMPFNEDLPRNRLGLTKWLFDKKNPLTARVFVNRLWQMHFGSGLVATSDDFGNQGNLPSHPKLLDWLAVEFMESDWDIKRMHKFIVMSATFQQSSEIRPELLEIDTDNVLLARGPSRRMTAEMVRDNALAISGLLSPKVGGPSVYPYQPEGLWDEISNKPWRYRYKQEPGEGLYRRSLYTIWKRTSAPPSMQIFDVGDRSVCTVSRRQTSTPLQALVLLNDPQFVEASYVLAENIIEQSGNHTEKQLGQAFQLSTGRTPETLELKLLKKFYNDELQRFLANKEDAVAYLGMGETKIKSTSDPIKVAALATVINGIMNTSEGYTLR